MGRPRKYASNKDRVKAWRNRQKEPPRDITSTWDFSGRVTFPLRSKEAGIVAITAFYCCNGQIVKDSRGFRSSAYADSPHKLEPLLIVEGPKITRSGKRFYWNSYRKAHAEWLASNIKAVFKRKPPKLPKGVCPHCRQEDGTHDPECYGGGDA